jgi:hypothetical protein
LIEQLPITTTPKYNFPQTTQISLFPQTFLELSIRSLKYVKTNPQLDLTKPSKENLETQLSTLFRDHAKKLTIKLHALEPSFEKTNIVGIDVSSVKIGETSHGTLIATRGVIVYKQNGQYHYVRLGPIPLYITEETKPDIFNLLSKHCLNAPQGLTCKSINPSISNELTIDLNLSLLQTRITNLFEEWIHESLVSTVHESLILFDGSLTGRVGDASTYTKEKILKTAIENKNFVLAFSKVSRMRFLGCLLTDIIWKSQLPSLLEIQNLPEKIGAIKFLGKIYIARLKEKKYAYRLDMPRDLSQQQCVEAVRKLLGNDLLRHGYPETLRLAHILSTFTANEVLGIQRYLTKQYGLNIISKPDIRKMLFGPYGTSNRES